MGLSKMNLQPLLEDELIRLRPLMRKDFDPLYEVAKDPLIWEQHQIKNRYQPKVFYKFFQDSIESGGALVTIDKSSNRIIGSSRFQKINKVNYAIEIGWSFLARNNWGGHYNFSMKKLMIDYAFKYVSFVVFYIDIHNLRSQRAVKKIGGKKFFGNQMNEIVKKSETDLTYLIDLKNWDRLKSIYS